jgi:hypothetical protein
VVSFVQAYSSRIFNKDGKPDKNCKTSDVMDALQYICMDIGARISSDIDKYVNPS